LSFISNITQYGSDDVISLPSTKFEYTKLNTNWTLNTSWVSPVGFADNFRMVDVNGDGLVDIFIGDGTIGQRQTWINNGTNWVLNSSWTSPFGFETNTRMADVNGDGLIDIVDGDSPPDIATYINNGTNWDQNDSWKVPAGFGSAIGLKGG